MVLLRCSSVSEPPGPGFAAVSSATRISPDHEWGWLHSVSPLGPGRAAVGRRLRARIDLAGQQVQAAGRSTPPCGRRRAPFGFWHDRLASPRVDRVAGSQGPTSVTSIGGVADKEESGYTSA
jgi:hypothetical protein